MIKRIWIFVLFEYPCVFVNFSGYPTAFFFFRFFSFVFFIHNICYFVKGNIFSQNKYDYLIELHGHFIFIFITVLVSIEEITERRAFLQTLYGNSFIDSYRSNVCNIYTIWCIYYTLSNISSKGIQKEFI